MEPKKSSAQTLPQPRAATKKSPPRAATDADAVAAGVESPLSSLFHPHGVPVFPMPFACSALCLCSSP
jgi:hypothetical protein